MFSGPSALIAVEGRIDPVNTTGLSLCTTRFRKYDVSSMVSVPCVIATPATSGRASSSLTRLPSFSHTASFMSWLPMLAICSPVTSARSFSCGTAWIRRSTPTAPDWYPASVCDAAAPAIVPPVATMMTLGLPVAGFAVVAAAGFAAGFVDFAGVAADATAAASSRAAAIVLTYLRFMEFSLRGSARILALVEIGQLRRVEQVLDLRLGQHVLLADDLEDALAARVRL